MKTVALLALVGAFSVASSLATPLLRYEFDQPGTVQNSSGSVALDLSIYNYDKQLTNYVTDAPTTRIGSSSGRALNFTAGNVDAGLPSGQQVKGSGEIGLNDGNAAFLRGGLASFTLSAWLLDVKATNTASATRRLFSLRNSSGQQIIDFRLYNAPGSAVNEIHFGVHGVGGDALYKTTSVNVPVDGENWYFVSVTYEASNGLLTFYGGKEGGALLSETAWNRTGDEVNTLLKNANLLGLGNVGYQHQRRMDGYLADFRFYDSALTATQIGELYAIPEPSAVAMVSAGVAIAMLRRRTGRTSC